MSTSNQNALQEQEKDQNQRMQNYYKWQSKIYDATRWTFLFGRKRIVRELPLDPQADATILEVGCGTGFNLSLLAKRFPKATLIGLDVSEDMINLSKKRLQASQDRVQLHAAPYQKGSKQFEQQLDAILFSYSLTMINPQWSELIEQAKKDLKPGGYVAVVDFYDSRFQWFKNHMGNHHVRMDKHLTPFLKEHFQTTWEAPKPAYGGIWHYFYYIGRKP